MQFVVLCQVAMVFQLSKAGRVEAKRELISPQRHCAAAVNVLSRALMGCDIHCQRPEAIQSTVHSPPLETAWGRACFTQQPALGSWVGTQLPPFCVTTFQLLFPRFQDFST
jgi:hypothetical protein